MGAKLKAGMYKSLAAFEADFRLMVNNCKQYNADGTYAFNEAVALEQFFDKREPPLSHSDTQGIFSSQSRMGADQEDARQCCSEPGRSPETRSS